MDGENELSVGDRSILRVLSKKYEDSKDKVAALEDANKKLSADLAAAQTEAAKVAELTSKLDAAENARALQAKRIAALEQEVERLSRQASRPATLPLELASGKSDTYIKLPLSTVISESTKTGWLKKKANKGSEWKRRFCVLKDNYLFYYKTDKIDSEHRAKFVRLNSGKVARVPKDEFKLDAVFAILANVYLGKRSTYYFQATFESEATEWELTLAKAIDELPHDAKYEAAGDDMSDPAAAAIAAGSASAAATSAEGGTPRRRFSSRNRAGTLGRLMSTGNASPGRPSAKDKEKHFEFKDSDTCKYWVVVEDDKTKPAAQWRTVVLEVSITGSRVLDMASGAVLYSWSPRWLRVVKYTASWIAYIGRDSDTATTEQEWRFHTDQSKLIHDCYFAFIAIYLENQKKLSD